MLAQGKPHCYRFRVPANQTVTITDCIRGKVSWNTDTLGDFVVMRSNGLPVYNFCVAVDDALMKISHVIRAEEHLPNTLRQVSNSGLLHPDGSWIDKLAQPCTLWCRKLWAQHLTGMQQCLAVRVTMIGKVACPVTLPTHGVMLCP